MPGQKRHSNVDFRRTWVESFHSKLSIRSSQFETSRMVFLKSHRLHFSQSSYSLLISPVRSLKFEKTSITNLSIFLSNYLQKRKRNRCSDTKSLQIHLPFRTFFHFNKTSKYCKTSLLLNSIYLWAKSFRLTLRFKRLRGFVCPLDTVQSLDWKVWTSILVSKF